MKRLFHITFRAMGCEASVQLETEADGQAILRRLPEQVEAIEARLSRFRPDSELMRLNARAGTSVIVSDVLFDNILSAKHAARVTGGRFNPLVLPALLANGYDRNLADITLPETVRPLPAADWHRIEVIAATREVQIPMGSALDLGGIAKGWTAAHLAERLAPQGACLINLGGDMVARGVPNGRAGWQVDIEDPGDHSTLVSVSLRDASIVTSGIDFRRWTSASGTQHHHIIDPRTGSPADTDVQSVTVHHPHMPTAEALAKAVLLQGAERGLVWLDSQWDAAGLVVRNDGAVLVTSTFMSLVQEREVG